MLSASNQSRQSQRLTTNTTQSQPNQETTKPNDKARVKEKKGVKWEQIVNYCVRLSCCGERTIHSDSWLLAHWSSRRHTVARRRTAAHTKHKTHNVTIYFITRPRRKSQTNRTLNKRHKTFIFYVISVLLKTYKCHSTKWTLEETGNHTNEARWSKAFWKGKTSVKG